MLLEHLIKIVPQQSIFFPQRKQATKDGQVDTRSYSVTYDSNNPDGGLTPVPSSSGFFNATTPLEDNPN